MSDTESADEVKLSVMVPPALRDRLKALADAEDRTIGKHVARVLKDYVAEREGAVAR